MTHHTPLPPPKPPHKPPRKPSRSPAQDRPDGALPDSAPWINFQNIADPRGGLVVAEGKALPFDIKRVYWLHHLPGTPRGGHAHRRLWQVIVPLSGALTVRLTNAQGARAHRLDNPARGLIIGPMTWRVLDAIEPGTTCLVLASHAYDETDYIRDPNAFRLALMAAVPRLHAPAAVRVGPGGYSDDPVYIA